jgi:hypothetical protein
MSSLENGTANADPDGWFKSNVMGATPAGAKKLMGIMQNSPDAIDALRQGTISGLRDQIVKGNQETGNAGISADALNKALAQRRLTLGAILPDDTMTGLQRLSNTASRVTPPNNAPVNWSNSASTLHNLGQLKSDVGALAESAVSAAHPVGAGAVTLKNLAGGVFKNRAAKKAAEAGVNPSFSEPTNKGIPLDQLLMKPGQISSLLQQNDQQ